VSDPLARTALERSTARQADRRVVMVASADAEPSLTDVVTNLASVCADTGQRVALVSTAGLESPAESDLPQAAPLWWKHWPAPGNGASSRVEEERDRLLNGSVRPADVEHLLGETGVPRVSRLDLRSFVGHPAQVVIRVPEVIAALTEVVDVVFLEVPLYLSVHYGEGLTPLADVVLVVAERETSTITEMRRLKAALKRLDAPVVGMVLTEGGLQMFDWGPVESEYETPAERPSGALDPTEQIPISESTGASSARTMDEFSVVEHSRREG
jgi:hypothetical protein